MYMSWAPAFISPIPSHTWGLETGLKPPFVVNDGGLWPLWHGTCDRHIKAQTTVWTVNWFFFLCCGWPSWQCWCTWLDEVELMVVVVIRYFISILKKDITKKIRTKELETCQVLSPPCCCCYGHFDGLGHVRWGCLGLFDTSRWEWCTVIMVVAVLCHRGTYLVSLV